MLAEFWSSEINTRSEKNGTFCTIGHLRTGRAAASVTAEVRNRLIDVSFLLPRECQQINSYSQWSWEAWAHTHTHTHTACTRTHTHRNKAAFCISLHMSLKAAHTNTRVCSQGGVSLCLSISQEAWHQHHPNSLTLQILGRFYPNHFVVPLQLSPWRLLLTLNQVQGRVDDCYLYNWF